MIDDNRSSWLSYFLLLGFLLCTSHVNAISGISEVEALIAKGKLQRALSTTNKQLAKDKSNVNLLFLKGLILTKKNELEQAKSVFIALSKDHPELPEPYNNLAVIYAAQGDFDNARQALQDAINTHPSYATAHENMGDIYAKMASRAYNQALQLDKDNETAREKLSLIGGLFSVKANQQIELTDKTNIEVNNVKTELKGLEQEVVKVKNRIKQEQGNMQAIQLELEKLHQQKITTVEKAKQEETKAQKMAELARVKAKAELKGIEQELVKVKNRTKKEQGKMQAIQLELEKLHQQNSTAIEKAKQKEIDIKSMPSLSIPSTFPVIVPFGNIKLALLPRVSSY